MGIFKKIFGNYSEKEIKKVMPIVDKIMALDNEYRNLSEEDLKSKTKEFKERLKNGETLEDILIEAYATVCEASRRVLNMKPFKVQVIGGVILHQGRIAEMRTGEGKTLVATLPIYLNALEGKGVHLVTVNDYLAKTQSIFMGKLYKYLGLSVGLVVAGMTPKQKKEAYLTDITYGTNNEFGFDYLRDNMAMSIDNMVQRDLNYVIIDEIDSILIDEARTPLIISGSVNKRSDIYEKANKLAKTLKSRVIIEKDNKVFDEQDENYDYIVDIKGKNTSLTETGIKKVEEFFNIEDLSDANNLTISHHVNQAIRAYGLMNKDKDYIVKEGEVIIVDEFTGRLMKGRRYSDGLHQAIEAKENVKIAHESQTLASVTFQNYFKLYSKLAGMTGTAKTEENEFKGIYGLDIIEIPTNKEVKRIDEQDVIYQTIESKYKAIANEVKACYKIGRPVLVGTITIDKSEKISKLLKNMGIPHKVLNAKYHEKEAEIVAQAGKFKAVTIATNMAGRGTDIVLGGNVEYLVKSDLLKQGYSLEVIEQAFTPLEYDDEIVKEVKGKIKDLEDKYSKEVLESRKKVIEVGGLKIIGSERHESRRIDNQLRGRSGRQGDVGSSKFYISLQDDLMKLFGSERVMSLASAMNLPEDTPIELSMLTSVIEKAQKKIEGINYSIRKNVLEYDDVLNIQRGLIYTQRRDVLKAEDTKDMITIMVQSKLKETVNEYFNVETVEEVDFNLVNNVLLDMFKMPNLISKEEIDIFDEEEIYNKLETKVLKEYNDKHIHAKESGMKESLNGLEKRLILSVVDSKWMDHMDNISGLKDGINLRAYAQTNPLEAYKIESYDLFKDMTETIKEDSIKAIYSVKEKRLDVKQESNIKITGYENPTLDSKDLNRPKNITTNKSDKQVKKEPIRVEKKVGRNEPCPCGSGKKYKHCCGKNEE